MAATTAARATIGNTGPIPLRLCNPLKTSETTTGGNRKRQRLRFALQTAT
jgi:hypothetical protein